MGRKKRHRILVANERLFKEVHKQLLRNLNPYPAGYQMFYDAYASQIKSDKPLSKLNVKRAMKMGLEEIKNMYENSLFNYMD